MRGGLPALRQGAPRLQESPPFQELAESVAVVQHDAVVDGTAEAVQVQLRVVLHRDDEGVPDEALREDRLPRPGVRVEAEEVWAFCTIHTWLIHDSQIP